jgi:hypothetical protein
LTFETGWISGAIPSFMVMTDYRFNWVREIDRLENVGAYIRMNFHAFEFSRREGTGLVKDVLGDGKLSRIVQESRSTNGIEKFFVSHAKSFGKFHCVSLNSPNMPVCDLILRIDRKSEGLYCRKKDSI